MTKTLPPPIRKHSKSAIESSNPLKDSLIIPEFVVLKIMYSRRDAFDMRSFSAQPITREWLSTQLQKQAEFQDYSISSIKSGLSDILEGLANVGYIAAKDDYKLNTNNVEFKITDSGMRHVKNMLKILAPTPVPVLP